MSFLRELEHKRVLFRVGHELLLERGTDPLEVIKVVLRIHNHDSQKSKTYLATVRPDSGKASFFLYNI
jgi:hypothetical protein